MVSYELRAKFLEVASAALQRKVDDVKMIDAQECEEVVRHLEVRIASLGAELKAAIPSERVAEYAEISRTRRDLGMVRALLIRAQAVEVNELERRVADAVISDDVRLIAPLTHDVINYTFGSLRQIPRPSSEAARIALALLHASLEDALAIAGLAMVEDRVLLSPIFTLQRPLTEKLKRATWAILAPPEQVTTAYEEDRFPDGRALVVTIEKFDPTHKLFTNLFEATPSAMHAFVHGGQWLIGLSPYVHDNFKGLPDKALERLLLHVGFLAAEVGFAAQILIEKYDEALGLELGLKAKWIADTYANSVANWTALDC